jgi:AcrR family transcriptional regulator
MGATERRVRERESMRRGILRAASKLSREEGYEKLTIRKVADRIEYSPMALYNHFPDKDSILKALADEGFGRYLKALPKRSALPPIEELRRYLLSYIQFAVKQPEQYRLVFMTPRHVPNTIEPKGDQNVERIPNGNGRTAFAMLVEQVKVCGYANKSFRNSFGVALSLWTGIHGAASLLITLPHFPFGDHRAYAASIVDFLLSGLRASSNRNRSTVAVLDGLRESAED